MAALGEATCPAVVLQGSVCSQPHQHGGLAELCPLVLLCVKAGALLLAACDFDCLGGTFI